MCVDNSIESMLRTVIFVRTIDKRVKVEDLYLDSEVAFAEAKATIASHMVESLTGTKSQLREDVEFASSLIKSKEALGQDASLDKKFVGDLIERGLQQIYEKYKA